MSCESAGSMDRLLRKFAGRQKREREREKQKKKLAGQWTRRREMRMTTIMAKEFVLLLCGKLAMAERPDSYNSTCGALLCAENSPGEDVILNPMTPWSTACEVVAPPCLLGSPGAIMKTSWVLNSRRQIC
ncbi:unnamed protein product [Prorocentrum cordatum]|uniref:Uncharacterized protein n=1 Tax=Prorocentrum cordatum TaxID=2364126 RepID=A0ABN9THA1_9DINO|nr:unnamed protein product [Polarella glacialis]